MVFILVDTKKKEYRAALFNIKLGELTLVKGRPIGKTDYALKDYVFYGHLWFHRKARTNKTTWNFINKKQFTNIWQGG